jgi:hypothetical protein
MYRKPRRRSGSGGLGLDSLMDILSCLVGVMLFLVIYTVLELGTAAYQAEVVVSANPAPDSRRVLVLAEAGTVRVLDVRPALGELLGGFEIVQSVPEVELFVESSRSFQVDPHFRYSLAHESRSTTDLLAMLDLVVEESAAVRGDSINQLGEGSRYLEALAALDPGESWLAFAVDTASADVFRRARELAIENGFATGFDLLSLDFPLTLPLSSNGIDDLLNPIGPLSKPQR